MAPKAKTDADAAASSSGGDVVDELVTIEWRGDEPYSTVDNGRDVYVNPGGTMRLSKARAAQLLEDRPEEAFRADAAD